LVPHPFIGIKWQQSFLSVTWRCIWWKNESVATASLVLTSWGQLVDAEKWALEMMQVLFISSDSRANVRPSQR
jgi:hypothetical protein